MLLMMMIARKTMMTTMRRLFGYHYHNPVVIAIVIMALAVGRKLPPVVNGHAHRWRNTGYDVMEEDDFDEGSTDSAYRMTSYDDDDDVDVNFDPDLAYLTRCQKHRKNEKTFDVSCLDDGSYNSTQCHAETMECWCVDDNGDYIQDSIRKLPERPKCKEKVRPTFTLTLVTPSKQPSTTSIINRLFEKAGIPSPNQQQLGYTDPVPSEDAITQRNQLANQSRNEQEEEEEGDDDDHHHGHHNRHHNDHDDDDGEIGVKNHRDVGDHGNGMMKEFDDDDDDDDDDDEDEEEEEDEDDDDEDDGVTQTSSNKLLRRDPVYTTGLILVVLLSSSIVIIMAVLFIHRIKRKDEGTYTLASNAIISTIGYSVSKDTEYFA